MNRYDEFAEIQKYWRPPVELSRSAPREARLTKGGVALMVLAFVLFAGGIAAGVFLGKRVVADGQRHKAFEHEGRETDAVITRLWRTGGKDSHYKVAYTFQWEGHTYRGQSNIRRRAWADLSQGDSISIRFVPSNPEWNYPRVGAERPMPVAVPIVVSICLAVPALLILMGVRRQKRLIEEGRPAPALIRDRKKVQHAHGGGQTVLTYEFPLLGGSIAKGKAGAPKGGGEVGSVLCAIYLPDNPRRNALYPLDLARPGE